MPGSRMLAIVGLAGAVHLVCAWALLWLLGAGGFAAGGALAVVVVVTVAVALSSALRVWRVETDLVTRMAPGVFGLVPPVASLGLGLPWIWAAGSAGIEQALLDTLPVLAATVAPGVAIALTLEYSLWTVAARIGAVAGQTSSRPAAPGSGLWPPSLAGRLARLVAGLGLATGLLVLAEGLGNVGDPRTWLALEPTWLALVGCLATMTLAVLAAASAGLSPGRDVQALAARLDAIGWDDEAPGSSASAAARPLAEPVRITSFDTIGALFRNLERLRARLAEDVATYQRALDRTHAADAAKREFLAAVSHELRTPLNSILDLAQALLDSDLNRSQAEDVRLIQAGGRQLRGLIEDILDISMIESGELELRLAACDLCELVEELVDIQRAQVRGPEVELVYRRRGSIPTVACDRKRVGQVLTNLLSNAIKFTEQGRVLVTLRHDVARAHVVIAVTDTGVGIASDELGTIFEEYRQVGARKPKIRGTGLGLAIARRIAAAHGGSLVAESQLDVGSTFTLRLPLDPIESAEVEP